MGSLEGYKHNFGSDEFTFFVGHYTYKDEGGNEHRTNRISIVIGWGLVSPYQVLIKDTNTDTTIAYWVGEAASQTPQGGYLSPSDVLERLGLPRAISFPKWLTALVVDGWGINT